MSINGKKLNGAERKVSEKRVGATAWNRADQKRRRGGVTRYAAIRGRLSRRPA